MDKQARIEMVRAMETLSRAVNDEDVFQMWIRDVIPDGDIDDMTTDEELEYFIQDDVFSYVMYQFMILMERAKQNEGLTCDGACSL